MSSRDRPRDDDLEERLDELEDVLTELRRDLKRDVREHHGPRYPPRPPRLSELLRFTEQYTIPTLIALLEATITSLELLRGTLRLADPNRGLELEGGAMADRLVGVRDEANAGLARSLSELRTALSDVDLPEESTSRTIIEDARDLTAEIEARIEEGRRGGRPDRDRADSNHRHTDGSRSDGKDRDDEAVHIDVTDPAENADGAGSGVADDDGADDPSPSVDVESELESIKQQFGQEDSDEEGSGSGSDSDAEDAESGGDDDTSNPEMGAEGSDAGTTDRPATDVDGAGGGTEATDPDDDESDVGSGR